MVLSVKPKRAWMMKERHSVLSSWLRTPWMRSHMDHCIAQRPGSAPSKTPGRPS